jgi:hypothetical protein
MEDIKRGQFAINFFINFIFFVIGLVVGVFVSEHYYQKGQKDLKKELIESTLSEISVNLDKNAFPEVNDSLKFLESKYPYPLLESNAVQELAVNSKIFRSKGGIFKNKVYATKFIIDDFNQRIYMRNFIIYIKPTSVIEQNSYAYSFYQKNVKPKLMDLNSYVEKHREELLK